mmetsp:Transcript_31862/g.70042  ORF Transcript_31862/g.70042 Transcript_31862/m.70042 type:complete len:137 (-) Transcript_31862:12-422(-)
MDIKAFKALSFYPSLLRSVHELSYRRLMVAVARHHWLEAMFVMMDETRERMTTPISAEDAEKWRCLHTTYKTDTRMRYNSSLGKGKSQNWMKKHPIMYVKAPNVQPAMVQSLTKRIMAELVEKVALTHTHIHYESI